MKKTYLTIALSLLTAAAFTRIAQAHCEVPCGVYTDTMRIQMIEEDCKTIEKAMGKIASGSENANQTARWVATKEEHCNQIQKIASQYFMTQRIKPDADKYVEKLTTLHGMLQAAMKCKQTTDTENVAKIRNLSHKFVHLYFSAEDQKHLGHQH